MVVTVEVTVWPLITVEVMIAFDVTVEVTGASEMVIIGPFADTVMVGPGRKTVDVRKTVEV